MNSINKRSLFSITLFALLGLVNFLYLPGCTDDDSSDDITISDDDDDDYTAPANEYIYSGQCSESTIFAEAGTGFVFSEYIAALDEEISVEVRDYLRCCDDTDGDPQTFVCDVAYHFEHQRYQQPATTLTATYPLLLGKVWLRPSEGTDIETLSDLLAPLGVTVPLTLADAPDSYHLIPAEYDPLTNPLELAEQLVAIEQLDFSAFAVEDANYETALFETEIILRFFEESGQELAEEVLSDLGLAPDYSFTWGENFIGNAIHNDSYKNNLQSLALLRLIFNTAIVQTGKMSFTDASKIKSE
jgi:hypothetical protein